MSDLTITRGDDPIFDLYLATTSGAADLAGVDLWFTAKESVYDADVDAVIQKVIGSGITVVNESGGIVTISIDHADTVNLRARYLGTPLVWDVQLKDAIGDIQTVANGTLTIEPDITHST
jgi:hypothetical protein